MCGIAGIFHSDRNKPIHAQLLANMAAIQYHRGPDGFGVERFETHGVGFSHARLSIIDLDENRARQPFCSEDNRLLLAHNGEFYDFQRIRANLVARGARWLTKSDSELVLQLYPRLGLDDTMRHLRGEFAFSLYDKETETLSLVRDRFGIKPLYWTQTKDGIVFGSEIKVLFAHPDVKRAFDNEGVLHQLMQTIVPGTTPFAGVYQVEPGQIIEFKRNGDKGLTIERRKYWDLDFPEDGAHISAEEEDKSVALVRDKLLEAVQHRLVADVPVGCYLSGGIDSCSILGLASAVRQDPIKAFTIAFADDDYDESTIATEMAHATGAEQDILRLEGRHLYDHFKETHWHTERTIYNTLGVAKLLMSRHVHSVDYKVVITGEGSDELFAGYPSFRADMIQHGLPNMDADERGEWQQALGVSNTLFKGAMLSQEEVDNEFLTDRIGFTPACLQPWLAAAPTARAMLTVERQEQLNNYDPGFAIAERLDRSMLMGRHALDRAQYVWAKTMLEGQILTWGGDRVDMANSMEARPAFLDHHLAEAAFTISPLLRIKNRREKHVLREAMKGLLPQTLYEREKFAFMAPPATVNKENWKAMMALADTYLCRERIETSNILDFENVQGVLREAEAEETSRARKIQLDAIINHLMGVQIMHELFIDNDVPNQAANKARELGWDAKEAA